MIRTQTLFMATCLKFVTAFFLCFGAVFLDFLKERFCIFKLKIAVYGSQNRKFYNQTLECQ